MNTIEVPIQINIISTARREGTDNVVQPMGEGHFRLILDKPAQFELKVTEDERLRMSYPVLQMGHEVVRPRGNYRGIGEVKEFRP